MRKKLQKIIITALFIICTAGILIFINTKFAYNLHLTYYTLPENNSFISKLTIQKSCAENEIYCCQLNDHVHQYLEESYLKGIRFSIKNPFQIKAFVEKGLLTPILNSEVYIIDTLKYSHPYLTPKAKNLLQTIGTLFQNKLKNTNVSGTKLIVTSLLRTTSSIKKLRRINRNAIRYSAHLHGTTFDISYEAFHHPFAVNNSEIEILREILAKTLFELRNKNKCWVTYERAQSCFHIVSR